MKIKKIYTKPTCDVVLLYHDLMSDEQTTLPGFGSGTTDSGDDSGGGLAKQHFVVPDDTDNAYILHPLDWEND